MEGQMVQLINWNDCLAISPEKENKSNLDHSFNWTPFRRKGRTSVQWSIRSADVDHSVCFGVRLGEQSRIFNLDAWFDSVCGCLNQRCAQRHLVQANGFPWFPFPWSSTLHSGECTSFIGTTIDKWLILLICTIVSVCWYVLNWLGESDCDPSPIALQCPIPSMPSNSNWHRYLVILTFYEQFNLFPVAPCWWWWGKWDDAWMVRVQQALDINFPMTDWHQLGWLAGWPNALLYWASKQTNPSCSLVEQSSNKSSWTQVSVCAWFY